MEKKTLKELKQNNMVINVQPWLLKKFNKDEKLLKRKLLLNFLALIFFSLVVSVFVRYSQSSYTAMYNGGFKTAVIFTSHSALAIKNSRIHG